MKTKVKVLCNAILGLLVLSTALVVGMFSWPRASVADPPKEKCDIQGSWMGYDPDGLAFWVATLVGQSSSSGASMFEVPGYDLTLNGMFPNADKTSVARGMWKRIDGRTFGNTAVALVVDTDGNALYLWKLAAIDTVHADCNTLSIINTVEFFYPDRNPFEDAPFYTLYGYPHTGMRITVDPPAFP